MLVRIMASWQGGDVPVDPEGFVHLSTPEQVPGTVQRHYSAASSLVFLVLDEGSLPAGALRVEEATGGDAFPHLYATLPASSVVRVVVWRAGDPIIL